MNQDKKDKINRLKIINYGILLEWTNMETEWKWNNIYYDLSKKNKTNTM